MKKVRIYRPSKTAMQSGHAKTQKWVLEYELISHRTPDPLMGWTSAGDTYNQVKLPFDTQESAVAFAESKGWTYSLDNPRERRVKPRNYTDNFKYRPPEDKEGARK